MTFQMRCLDLTCCTCEGTEAEAFAEKEQWDEGPLVGKNLYFSVCELSRCYLSPSSSRNQTIQNLCLNVVSGDLQYSFLFLLSVFSNNTW